jgi:hypothetical protein
MLKHILGALDEVDRQPGVHGGEVLQQRRQRRRRQRHVAAEGEHAAQRVTPGGHARQVVGVPQQLPRKAQDLDAGGGECHSVRLPPDSQLHIERPLQVRQRL